MVIFFTSFMVSSQTSLKHPLLKPSSPAESESERSRRARMHSRSGPLNQESWLAFPLSHHLPLLNPLQHMLFPTRNGWAHLIGCLEQIGFCSAGNSANSLLRSSRMIIKQSLTLFPKPSPHTFWSVIVPRDSRLHQMVDGKIQFIDLSKHNLVSFPFLNLKCSMSSV